MILIVGKSGSGKSYLAKILNLNQVISRTTRRIRKNEIDGIDKHFLNESAFNLDYDMGKVMAMTKINGHYYWAIDEDFEGKDYYIIDPDGTRYMREYSLIPITIVYIKTPIYRRIYRMRKRGDSLLKIFQRLFSDIKTFKNIEYDYVLNM